MPAAPTGGSPNAWRRTALADFRISKKELTGEPDARFASLGFEAWAIGSHRSCHTSEGGSGVPGKKTAPVCAEPGLLSLLIWSVSGGYQTV
jgi:hypothetical protein